jgi:hypothetical protein
MSAFLRQINSNPLGDELRERRLDRGINLKKASRDLGIAVKHLESLENWRVKEFSDRNFFNKVLDVYTNYLGLTHKEVNILKSKIVLPQVTKKQFFLSFSIYGLLVKFFFFAVFVALVAFLVYNFSLIFASPELKIITPLDGTITYQRRLIVSGVSALEADVFINNKAVLLQQDGSFEAEIDLQSGLNLINVSAQKKYGRTKMIELRILFRD